MGLTEGDCGWIWLSEKELLLLLGLNLVGCMSSKDKMGPSKRVGKIWRTYVIER